MAIEIERKFLVTGDRWRQCVTDRRHIVQAYLAITPRAEIRVRIIDDAATLTVKSARPELMRQEFEIAIALDQARALLELRIGSCIEKYRYRADPGTGPVWEIDEFLGKRAGLTLAEIELPYSEYALVRYDWLGAEVTDDPAYYNANLATIAD